MPAIPQFPNSYWVLADRLAAGEYPGSLSDAMAAAKLYHLVDAGIDLFIDLTEVGELEPYDHLLADNELQRGRIISHVRLPIRDMDVPSREEMSAILDTIDDAIAAGRSAYVHCWGGVGRTGTVVGCYLVRHGSTGAEALERVAALFAETPKSSYRKSPETRAQCRFVRDWIEPGRGGEELRSLDAVVV
jgi:hypothetical protein